MSDIIQKFTQQTRDMNVQLLQKARNFILTHPEHFDMEEGIGDIDAGCGTAACLGGTVCLLELGFDDPLAIYKDGCPWEVWSRNALSEEEINEAKLEEDAWTSVRNKAMKLLGIDKESEADALFITNQWYGGFGDKYLMAETPKERAAIASEYIDYFINRYQHTVED